MRNDSWLMRKLHFDESKKIWRHSRSHRRKLIILGSEVETMHEYSYVVPRYDSGRDDSFDFAS